ncbi:hypothetical protein WJX82_002830 [Trebouxia sp. C0006]
MLRVARLSQAQHRLRNAGDAKSPCRQRQLRSSVDGAEQSQITPCTLNKDDKGQGSCTKSRSAPLLC